MQCARIRTSSNAAARRVAGPKDTGENKMCGLDIGKGWSPQCAERGRLGRILPPYYPLGGAPPLARDTASRFIGPANNRQQQAAE